jgi:hypothetical protein
MKKLIGFVCLLVLVAACQPVANENKSMNTNTATETKSTAPPSEADLITKEKAAWDAFRRKDADALKKLMAPDYMEVLNTGTMSAEQSLAGMKDFEITDVTFADWKMMTVDKDAVILTYTANVKGTYQGKPIPEGPYHEASAYVSRNGEWLAIYYQETRSQPMPPAPAAKEEKATPSSSPMAKPAEAGPDVTANEKLVWDAIKSKNYDGFASYLASDSVEIEPDGVYDKAGSVKGVQMFDASKAELSDWKTVKFDDDASLVTYKVTIPGTKPDVSYHTTIWVKRDNKWQALFHMGTPAEAPAAAPATASPEKKM